MTNLDKQDSLCQCSMEIFGINMEFDVNLKNILKNFHSKLERVKTKNKWNKEKNDLLKLIMAYLEIKKEKSFNNEQGIKVSENFINLAIEYCIFATYYDDAKGLFKKDGVPLVFVRAQKVGNQYGRAQHVSIEHLTEDELNGIICLY